MGQVEGRVKGESLILYSKGIALGRDSDYVTGQIMLIDGEIIFT